MTQNLQLNIFGNKFLCSTPVRAKTIFLASTLFDDISPTFYIFKLLPHLKHLNLSQQENYYLEQKLFLH